MRAELGLPSVKGDDEVGGGMTGGFGGSMGGASNANKGKRPINVKFEIPYFTTSGIQVRYLKIIEPKVSPAQAVLFRSFCFGSLLFNGLFLYILTLSNCFGSGFAFFGRLSTTVFGILCCPSHAYCCTSVGLNPCRI